MGFSVRVAVAEVKKNTCENTYRLSRESGLARETFLSLKKPKYHMISEYKIITEKKEVGKSEMIHSWGKSLTNTGACVGMTGGVKW